MMMRTKILPEEIDIPLLLTVGALVGFGLLMVYSSSFIYAQERTGDGYSFILRQAMVAILGGVALVGAARIPYRKWSDWGYPLLAVSTALLALVLLPGVGSHAGGAQRWIKLGPIGIQPGEFAKFAVIAFVAHLLDRKSDRLHKFVPGVVSPFLLALPALLLLMSQPDFGTTVMISMVMFCLMFIAGVPKRILGGALLLGGSILSWLAFSTPYRRARVMTFLDPWVDPGGRGFQVIQSMLGLHNGGVTGSGLGNGKEKLFYLPEAHNDFIFAVIGEELGFIGVAAVVGAYIYFIYRGLKIAFICHQRDQDLFGTLLASGITLVLGLQGFVNMGVVMGLLPTKGLTLPFVSYGGSALLVDLFAVGVLLSVARGKSAPV